LQRIFFGQLVYVQAEYERLVLLSSQTAGRDFYSLQVQLPTERAELNRNEQLRCTIATMLYIETFEWYRRRSEPWIYSMGIPLPPHSLLVVFEIAKPEIKSVSDWGTIVQAARTEARSWLQEDIWTPLGRVSSQSLAFPSTPSGIVMTPSGYTADLAGSVSMAYTPNPTQSQGRGSIGSSLTIGPNSILQSAMTRGEQHTTSSIAPSTMLPPQTSGSDQVIQPFPCLP
jgi:hypothetical protein